MNESCIPLETLSEVEKLKNKISFLEERIAWFERQFFGRKSERFVDVHNDNILYLPGFEPGNLQNDLEEQEVIPEHKRKKRKKRKEKNDYSNGLLIPEGLTVEQSILDISEEEKICSETGEKAVKIGEEVTRKLAHQPAYYFVKEIIRPKYAFPSQEEKGVVIQDLPDSILPRSRADESLLAEIVTRKFADHLPLYRLSEIFSRDGVQLTRQLLSTWVNKLGTALLPLYLVMLEHIKASNRVFIDESPLKLQVKGSGKLQQAYMWVLVGGEGADPPYRFYKFTENREHRHAFDLMKGFSGLFHADKYGAYEKLALREGLEWQCCWYHIRRKFEEAQSGDQNFKKWILRKIRYLSLYERIAWKRSPEERLRIRRVKEAPIIDEIILLLKAKVEDGACLPKSKFTQALNYAYGLQSYMKTYINSPFARMDNNPSERAFRALAIGRKNWLFVGSKNGGESTAVLLSFVQTCRNLKINPRDYLEDIMRRIQNHPFNRLSELLPDQWQKETQKKTIFTQPLHIRK